MFTGNEDGSGGVQTPNPECFKNFVKTSVGEDEDKTLLSRRYLTETLPESEEFGKADITALEALIEDREYPLIKRFENRKDAKERAIEEDLVTPVLKALGLKAEPQGKLDEEAVDFLLYSADSPRWESDYSNTYGAVEVKRYGRL